MQETEFYELVEQRSHLDTDDRAREGTQAVLETLGEALVGGQAEDVADQLPTGPAGMIEGADHDGAGYDREEFVQRVSEHLQGTDVKSGDAERVVEGVTDVIAETLTQGERQNLQAQLDEELQDLFENVEIDRDAV